MKHFKNPSTLISNEFKIFHLKRNISRIFLAKVFQKSFGEEGKINSEYEYEDR
jgi:hypothetical protein